MIKNDKLKKGVIRPRKERNYKIWEQLDLVIKDNTLSNYQKQEMLSELQMLIIPCDDRDFKFNENVVNQIFMTVSDYNPELLANLSEKLLRQKCWKKLKRVNIEFGVEKFIKLSLYILIFSLNHKEVLSKTLFQFHLTFLLHQMLISKKDVWDFTRINASIQNSIRQDLHISQIKISNFQKEEREIWKCVLYLTDQLILEKIVMQASEKLVRPTNVNHKHIYSDRGPNNKSKYSMTSLALNHSLSKDIDKFSMLFFDNWPQLAPVNYTKSSSIHSELAEGRSNLIPKTDLVKCLNVMGGQKLHYNYPLFLEARKNIRERMFEVSNTYSISETQIRVALSRVKLENTRHIPLNILKIERLKTIGDYFAKTRHPIKLWVLAIPIPKRLKKNTIFEDLLRELENMNDEHVNLIFKSFFQYIILNYDKDSPQDQWDTLLVGYGKTVDELEKFRFFLGDNETESISYENEFSLDKDYYDFLSKLESNSKGYILELLLQNLSIILELFEYLTLSQICNFNYLSKTYSQKGINIFSLWSERILQEHSKNNPDALKLIESDRVYQKYIDSVGDHNLNVLVQFKTKMMDLYQNVPFYLKSYISANGRIALKGFSPHHHSGKLGRFTETNPEVCTFQGLQNLQCVLSSSYGNSFGNEQEHIRWVENNMSYMNEHKYDNIVCLVYKNAYEKVLNNEPIGTLIRSDHVASALTYYGMLSGCSYYKKITNFTKGDQIYKPYEEIGKDFMLPAFETIRDKWREKYQNMKVTKTKSLLMKIMDEILIPNAASKKFCKKLVMAHAYGMTSKGIGDELERYLLGANPDMKIQGTILKDPWFTGLCYSIWHALNKASPRTTKLRRILTTTLSSIQKAREDDVDTTLISGKNRLEEKVYSTRIEHFDSIIQWDYKTIKVDKWSVWSTEKQYAINKYIRQMQNQTDWSKTIDAFLPMFVHNIDAAVIKKMVTMCKLQYDFDALGVHDCGMCHPNYFHLMKQVFKTAIYEVLGKDEMTNKQFFEKVWLYPTLEHLRGAEPEKCFDSVLILWNEIWREHPDLLCNLKSSEVFLSEHNFSNE